MTLHWWMHWFWVTLRVSVVVTGLPLPSTTIQTTNGAPSTIHDSIILGYTSKIPPELSQSITGFEKPSVESISRENIRPASAAPSSPSFARPQNLRVPKAIGIERSTSREAAEDEAAILGTSKTNKTVVDDPILRLKLRNDTRLSQTNASNLMNYDDVNVGDKNGRSLTPLNKSSVSNSSNKKDGKLTWIFTSEKIATTATTTTTTSTAMDNGEDDRRGNSSSIIKGSLIEDERDLAVLPLQEPTPTRFKLVLNRTKFIPSTNLNDEKLIFDKSVSSSDDVEIRREPENDGIIGPRILATAASIVQGISESPRSSRARSAFPGDYQQDEQEKREEKKQDRASENLVNATSTAVDIAAVTGSCLATLVLIGTMGSLGFVMYRRRYLNPPQTLNSDKCSNPDSSGYIDDSTIRDNSEEMYSLDNDSFLNSLEAMTIQNYWTDSVKHTKL